MCIRYRAMIYDEKKQYVLKVLIVECQHIVDEKMCRHIVD